MKIFLSPQRRSGHLAIEKAGDVLTINGEGFDFSSLPDGATIPEGIVPCEWVIGAVERVDGDLQITVILPHGPNPPEALLFPASIINPPDGPIVLPVDPEDYSTEEKTDVEA